MKKRILAGMMMMILVLASAMCVSAAPSRTEPDYPSGESVKKYEIKSEDGVFSELSQGVQNVIKELNNNKVTSLGADVQKQLEGKTLLNGFADLTPIGNHSDCTSRKYHEVEITVTSLTDKCSDVVVLSYIGGSWKVITPIKVEGNKITVRFSELSLTGSPFGIYAKVAESSATGTSPKTEGVSSTWMLWAAMALVVLGSGVVVSQKRRG